MKLIDKSALVAEIERRIESCAKQREDMLNVQCHTLVDDASARMGELRCFQDFLDTLEVKEVDLKKEYMDFLKCDDGRSMFETAKHLFELGMCVNNPITAADRGIAEEIIINLKRVEKDYRINLTREMEWLRNKVKKGE